MTEYRTSVAPEARPDPAPALPAAPDPAERARTSLWRRLADAVVAGHRSDVPF